MDKKQTGGSAFPRAGFEYLNDVTDERVVYLPDYGMSIRDYFAAKAMQAMVATPTYEAGGWTQDSIAAQSYSMADAMLKERDK